MSSSDSAPPAATVELVTIGDELLLGATVDSNAAHIARALAEIGIGVVRHTTVGDVESHIVAALGEALERTGAVITTGGLGPTEDDRTREAISVLRGTPLRRDEGVAGMLRERWERIGGGAPIPDTNLTMAMVPVGAELMENRLGAAPGLWMDMGEGRWVAALPGVPVEMRGILAEALLPRLSRKTVRIRRTDSGREEDQGSILWRTLRTTGIPESRLAELLAGSPRAAGVTLAYLPGEEGVDLRLTVRGHTPDDAIVVLERAIAPLYALVGEHVYGEGDTDLSSVVLDVCRARGWRVGVAESCTGGLLGARLTAHAGSSDVVVGGVISYANEVKTGILKVDGDVLALRGAVSEEVARQMAAGVRALLSTDVGIGITGVAGPGGGSAEKPVGSVWIAVDIQGVMDARLYTFPGDRAEVRFRATQAALDMIRRAG